MADSNFPSFDIFASTAFAVANRNGIVSQPTGQYSLVVWPPTATDPVIDGSSGSTLPVAFPVPKESLEKYNVGLRIKAKCTFPATAAWPRGKELRLRLQGTLQGQPQPLTIISSKEWFEVLPPADKPSPETREFDIVSFTITAPFAKAACPVPFRIAGDFKWEIKCIDEGSNAILPKTDLTRLEMLWLLGGALNDEGSTPLGPTRTRTDLNGVYPVDLLRLFLPGLTDLLADQSLPKEFRPWWIKHTLTRIVSDKLLYDTIAGKSRFGMGCCGGSFKFDEFMGSISGSGVARINSFDLAALTQLASSLLVDGAGNEVLASNWVCMTPFGDPKPGIPFGITDKTVPAVTWPPGVNNPYFSGVENGQAFETKSIKIEPMHARAWIEADFNSEKPRVIDWAYQVPHENNKIPEYETGSQDRVGFASSHINEAELDISNFVEGSGGTCFCNNDFGESQSETRELVARVGLCNIQGLNTPRRGARAAPLVPIPPDILSDITEIIKSGKNRVQPGWKFNDASLKAMNVAPIIRGEGTLEFETNGDLYYTRCRVTPGAVNTNYVFNNMPLDNHTKGQLIVNIYVYNSFGDAYRAMEFELSTYERNLNGSEFCTPIRDLFGKDEFVGHYSLQTPRSVMMLRGNLFVEMSIHGSAVPNHSAPYMASRALIRLDQYLAGRTVSKSQVRRAQLGFIAPPPKRIASTANFKVQMNDDGILAPQTAISISPGVLLIHLGFQASDLSHLFWAPSRKDSKDATAIVTVAGAHIDTFHPGEISFSIVIGGLKQVK